MIDGVDTSEIVLEVLRRKSSIIPQEANTVRYNDPFSQVSVVFSGASATERNNI
jgi:hypothetical protein